MRSLSLSVVMFGWLGAVIPVTHLLGAPLDLQRDPVAVRQTFTEISARLDQGGDLFVIANTQGIFENFVDSLVALAQAVPANDDTDVAAVARKVADFLKQNGFYAVEGFGFSIVPRDDGLHDVKSFVKREAEAAALPLWRWLVGGASSPMNVHSYLPRDTVMARSGTGDIKFLWQLVQNAVSEIGGDEVQAGFDLWQETMTAMSGTSPADLIGSIAPESVFSIQLSRDANIEWPLGDTTLTVPQPSLLLVTAVNEHKIIEVVKQTLQTNLGMPLPEVIVDDATLHTIPFPVPAPFPVAFTIATHGNYLLLGSTEAVVRDALTAFNDGNGLKAEAEFVAAFPDLAENNGILFMSRRFSEAVGAIQKSMLAQTDSSDVPEGFLSLIQKWADDQAADALAMTIMNYRNGVLTSGKSTSGGHDYITAMFMVPVGMVAGMTLPAFIQARTRAQEVSCINNLRMLDAAKEQWAMLHGKVNGEEPDPGGVFEYIRGGMMPQCPQGGVYSLNPIGTSPQCSIHGSFDDFFGH